MSTRARATSMRAVRHGQQRTLLDRILRWLYGAGEQGIAVPDLTPGNGFLFQDSAGTTPVTAYEQPVGLILDRSKGLVLGPELVTNGTFASNIDGWTSATGGTLSWSAGKLRLTTGLTYGRGYASLTTTIGKWYQVTGSVARVGGTGVLYFEANTSTAAGGATSLGGSSALNSAATQTFRFLATTTTTYLFVISSAAGNVADFDNISVRELPGNHIVQATSTKRPTLSARYNLLTYSENFSNAAWATNNTVVGSSGTAPDGTNTATSFQGNGSATTQFLYNNTQYNNRAGEPLTGSVYLKYGNRQYVQIVVGATGSDMFGVVVDLIAGSITATGIKAGGIFTSSSIQGVGNGWYRVSFSGSSNASNNGYFQVFATDSSAWFAGTPSVAASTKSVLLWGADLRLTIDTIGQPAYQRVGAATDYDTAGFFPYLRFDGTDDSMATAASVDFTSTDKMTVFHGVTKLSDAALGMLFELSPDINTNNGAFYGLFPNSNGSSSAVFASKGSIISAVSATGIGAPITLVASCESNISADVARFSVNGAAPGTSSNDQGTGNYGNYPLFLGARNNASIFFNGRLYPFFIRGAATDAGLISQTEQFLKTRMPVTF